MKYGLTKATIEKICAVFARFREIEKVVLYGSRAKGSFKPGSDIDLTLYGEALTADLRSAIASALDDLLLPYTIDLSVFDDLDHVKLREHIERVGVVFYERGSAGEHQGVAMKKGWKTETLGELCEVFDDGDWVESKDQSPDGIRLIQTGNVGEGTFKDRAEKARYISETTFKRLRCTEIFEGDCLISRLPDPVGRSCILPDTGERMITAVDCSILRFKPNQLLSAFFNYYSQSDDYLGVVAKECTGTTRNRISRSNLGLTPIPVPPLVEQQRIVGTLDEAFTGIATAKANAEKNLQNARALFESHLQSVFTQRGPGWVEKRLEQIGTTQTGSTPKTSERANYGDYIAFVKPADFNTDGSLDYENDGLTELGLSEARKVAAGSVLMVCIGATIGKCGYCDRDITTNQQVNALTPSKDVSHKFIYYQMLTEDFQRRVMLSSAQATLPIINKSKWSALTAVLPPKLEEQKRIAAKFESLCAETESLASLYERKLAALHALKKSLLHQAFTGEL